jgi:hypothetical protein
MLNELYTLDRSLRCFKVDVGEAHPWVKRLGRGDLLIAGVDGAGLVGRVEHEEKQTAVTFFKIQESNHSNFPQLNWNAPLWHLDPASPAFRTWQACPADDVRKRAFLLQKACVAAEISEEQAHIVARMRGFCAELRPRFPSATDAEFAAFPTLIGRILDESVSAEVLVRSMSNAMLASVEKGLVPLAPVEMLLAGDLATDDRKAKVAILFDLADCTKFRCRVASPQMGAYFSRRLNETDVGGADNGLCALTGIETSLETDKLPSPRLPVLGDTVLMSMNPDTPCQARYGRIGTDIFPLGKRTAKALNAALLHLSAADRDGKNWKRIPGTTRKKSNLLLVYLESSPMLEAPIAEMFTGGESEARYTALCAEVCEALRGRAVRDSELLHLFVLNKIDPGRVQVELSEAFTAAQAIRGGIEWRAGARNRPRLVLQGDDFVPSPSAVMRCLQMNWQRGGTSYSDAPGCRLADVYNVLIADRSGTREAASLLRRLTLLRTSDLLMASGHAAHRGANDSGKSIAREGRQNAVIAVSLLGITLYRLGDRKETYMQEPSFLIGRFLSLTDTLHVEYCKGARNGDMPPQLLGNALIPTAVADPNKGFARMLQRLRPYQAWARSKRGSGVARWSCAEMGKIATEIARKLPGQRLNEAEQAQLLLGYLARSEKTSEEGVQE